MRIVYARQPFPEGNSHCLENSIFLAGPTPRRPEVASWRPGAIEIFRAIGFEGTLLVPEDEDGIFKGDYDDQIEWEEEGLTRASCILFWIPRNLVTMPAFTTNDEWGVYKQSGRVVFGAPPDAEKVRYQWHYAEKYDVPRSEVLEELIPKAIDLAAKQTQKRIALEYGVFL